MVEFAINQTHRPQVGLVVDRSPEAQGDGEQHGQRTETVCEVEQHLVGVRNLGQHPVVGRQFIERVGLVDGKLPGIGVDLHSPLLGQQVFHLMELFARHSRRGVPVAALEDGAGEFRIDLLHQPLPD